MKRGIGRRTQKALTACTPFVVALAVAVSVVLGSAPAASAHTVKSVSIDCYTVSGDFTGFQAGDVDLTFSGNDTVSIAPGRGAVVPFSKTYAIHGFRGHFGPFDLPAPAGTVSRSLTITWTVPEGPGKLVVATDKEPIKVNCPPYVPPVTPPVTPPVEQPPVATPPAPPAVVTPPATPVTPIVPAKPTPKVYKPHLTLTKKALDKSPLVGHAARFTLEVCNDGKGDAHNVVLSDDGGTGLTFTARNGGSMSDGSLQWQLGTIKAGKCHPLQGVQMRVDRDAKGNPCDNATVTASNGNIAHAQACVSPRQPKHKPKLPGLVTG